MDNIVYIVSDVHDYNMLICSDAGPTYANSMGWKFDYLRNISKYLLNNWIIIFDTRLEEEEFKMLYNIVKSNTQTQFISAVTDPCFEQCIGKPLYQFLFRTTTLSNVKYLTQYNPAEIVAFLRDVKGPNQMVVVNYPYLKEKEVSTPFRQRINKILFSGSTGSGMYPERYQFWKKSTRSIWRLKIDTLRHPGYPSSGQQFAHRFVGHKYVQHLSNYRFMFVSGSRCEAELLKYSECAYAGCVPVGYAPSTFDDRLRKYVLPIKGKSLTKSLLSIFSVPEKELIEIASGYRKEFAMQRDPALLNQKFQSFLNSQ